jgi:phosphatidyl-myo-inositol alpha-mannosyltransferase
VLGLAAALRALGHDVEVLAPGSGPPCPGVTSVGRSVSIRVNGSVAPMAPHPAAAWRTVRRLRGGDFDVLHLHEPLAPSITIPALLVHPAPSVATFHAAGDRTPYRWFGPPLRRLARRLDARVAVSGPAQRLVLRHLGGPCEVLGNGVDVHRYASVPSAPAASPTVLFLGRHESRKGLSVLLVAMRLLPREIELWIGGDGPARSSLQRRWPDDRRIHWLGRLADDEKIRRLRAASVLCVPSLHGESSGVVLLEAMAAGTPIVASDIAGYRSLAGDGPAALLVRPDDPMALAEGLRHVLCDPWAARRLQVAGHDRVQEFGIDALAERYVAIYERIA